MQANQNVFNLGCPRRPGRSQPQTPGAEPDPAHTVQCSQPSAPHRLCRYTAGQDLTSSTPVPVSCKTEIPHFPPTSPYTQRQQGQVQAAGSAPWAVLRCWAPTPVTEKAISPLVPTQDKRSLQGFKGFFFKQKNCLDFQILQDYSSCSKQGMISHC